LLSLQQSRLLPCTAYLRTGVLDMICVQPSGGIHELFPGIPLPPLPVRHGGKFCAVYSGCQELWLSKRPMVWPNRKARPPVCPKRMHRLILLNLESLLPAVRALLHLVTTNKSNTLHYLRLDSGVLRIVLSRRADCAKCACFLGVERRLSGCQQLA